MEFAKGGLCSAQTYSASGFGSYYPCCRKAKVERDGKLYCTIHDPEYIKKKKRKWDENFDKERAGREKVYALEDAKGKACQGLTIAELQALNPNLLKAAPAMYEALKELAHKFRVAAEMARIPKSTIDKELTETTKALAQAEGGK